MPFFQTPLLQNLLKNKINTCNLKLLRNFTKCTIYNESVHLMKSEPSEKSFSNNSKRTRELQSKSGIITVSRDRKQQFMYYFPDIVQELKGLTRKYDPLGVTEKHFERVLQYNVPDGKMYCGISVLPAYELMVQKESLTEADVKLANYLGWCVEMIKAMLLIDDDIMDGSITRRGKPCWYKLEDVQLSAINDGLLIEESVYYLLKKHFSHLQCYARLMEHFREMTFIGGVGQYLDSKSTQQDVLSFTMEQFRVIAQNKASYSGIYFPIAAAMHLAMCTDPEAFRQAESICLEIGYFVQLQNDFLDCFGDPEVTGKLGTDIQEGKCTWLAVMCLQRATMAQKMILKECYGKNDSESVKRVKQLYEELSLRKICAKQEELSYNMICRKIQQTPERHPIRVLQKLLGKTCQNTN